MVITTPLTISNEYNNFSSQRRLGASRKTAKKPPKPCQTANNGVFPFPKLDSGGMAFKSLGNRVWSNSVQR